MTRGRGRPKLPDGEQLIHVSVRLPQHLIAQCKERGNISLTIRRALDDYFEPPLL